jgi:hypothetical protein
MIEDYFRQVAALIADNSIVHSSSITYDKRSSYIGLIGVHGWPQSGYDRADEPEQ